MQHTEQWPNGAPKAQYELQDGKRHGLHMEWHETGAKRLETTYADGEPHGPYTAWFANGLVEESGGFDRGERKGQWTQWYSNGQRRQVQNFEHGMLHGLVVRWDERSQITAQSQYVNGQVSNQGTIASLAPTAPHMTGLLATDSSSMAQVAGSYSSSLAPQMGGFPIVNQISINIAVQAKSEAIASAISESVNAPTIVTVPAKVLPEPKPVVVKPIDPQIKRTEEFRKEHPELFDTLRAVHGHIDSRMSDAGLVGCFSGAVGGLLTFIALSSMTHVGGIIAFVMAVVAAFALTIIAMQIREPKLTSSHKATVRCALEHDDIGVGAVIDALKAEKSLRYAIQVLNLLSEDWEITKLARVKSPSKKRNDRRAT